MTGARLDVALVDRGLARSRSAAASAIADGRVLLDGAPATRAATRVDDRTVLVVGSPDRWVGRAGGKLDAALRAFDVDPAGRFALDLGASTGGFTQVLLDRGAAQVVALDVGHGQLVPELRADPRVVVVEGENARGLSPGRLAALAGTDEAPRLIVADLSFISLTLVLPAIADVAHPDADVVCLIKPQFEVGRARVHDGVVTDDADRAHAVHGVLAAAADSGLRAVALTASAVTGARGNREVLVHLHRARGLDPAEWAQSIGRAIGAPGREAR